MKNEFAAAVRSSFQDRTIEKFWWYLAFETHREKVEESGGSVLFMGAAILEGATWGDVISTAFHKIAPDGSTTRGQPVKIPADKLPGAKYRNRLLSKTEVAEIWPDLLRDE